MLVLCTSWGQVTYSISPAELIEGHGPPHAPHTHCLCPSSSPAPAIMGWGGEAQCRTAQLSLAQPE